MRTIKSGTYVRWYVGAQDTCTTCKEVVEFDNSDSDSTTDEPGKLMVQWICKTCKSVNKRFRRSNEEEIKSL